MASPGIVFDQPNETSPEPDQFMGEFEVRIGNLGLSNSIVPDPYVVGLGYPIAPDDFGLRSIEFFQSAPGLTGGTGHAIIWNKVGAQNYLKVFDLNNGVEIAANTDIPGFYLSRVMVYGK